MLGRSRFGGLDDLLVALGHPTRLTVLSTIVGVAFIWLVVGLAS
jgi:hypothetical protein